jgi:hypothetical protein
VNIKRKITTSRTNAIPMFPSILNDENFHEPRKLTTFSKYFSCKKDTVKKYF